MMEETISEFEECLEHVLAWLLEAEEQANSMTPVEDNDVNPFIKLSLWYLASRLELTVFHLSVYKRLQCFVFSRVLFEFHFNLPTLVQKENFTENSFFFLIK